MKGRPRIPIEIKQIRGTVERSRELLAPMLVELSEGVPQPPAHLNALGLEYWDVTCRELKNNHLLTGVDLGLVAGYCNELGVYKKACGITEQEGEVVLNRFGDKVISPWYDVRSRALKQATQMGQLFGVTPSARGKIETGKRAPASKLELLQKSKIA